MDRFRIIIAIVIIIIIGALVFFLFNRRTPVPFTKHGPTATIKGHTFYVTLAQTDQQKVTGLSNTNSLPQDEGMYFPFDTAGYYGFWMKEMRYPLDILFIHNNKIVSLYQNIQPPKDANTPLQVYKPTEPADGVLEINAGKAKQYGIKTGDSVTTNF